MIKHTHHHTHRPYSSVYELTEPHTHATYITGRPPDGGFLVSRKNYKREYIKNDMTLVMA